MFTLVNLYDYRSCAIYSTLFEDKIHCTCINYCNPDYFRRYNIAKIEQDDKIIISELLKQCKCYQVEDNKLEDMMNISNIRMCSLNNLSKVIEAKMSQRSFQMQFRNPYKQGSTKLEFNFLEDDNEKIV